ncbi:MAG: outer membrane lipoprotein-sorting protein [Desulfobacterales bacterium]|nr:outer membrane lipoprotein-sorting protein [Desulfobacterales bacterium]
MCYRLAFVFLFVFTSISYAITGYEIADKVYNAEDGNDMQGVMLMKIMKSDGKIKERDLNYFRKDFDKESRALIVFRSPADVKGTSFLTWNHKDADNDQWLYMPALNRVKRITVSTKSQSFMGSDFSYEDLSKRSLQKDNFNLLKEEKVNNEDCYIVEAIAKDTSEAFPKKIISVRKDNFIVIKSDFYNGAGTVAKKFTVTNIKKVDDIWTVLSCKMENPETKEYTTLDISEIKYNSNLSERMFKVEGLSK